MSCSRCKDKTNSLKNNLCEDCCAKDMPGHFACKECGKHYHSSMTGSTLREGLCFKCNFWMDKVAWENDPEEKLRCVRVSGKHYHISEGFGFSKGFGGSKFCIQFKDGRLVQTSNLWHQGDIPAHFKKRLPDNAEFNFTKE